LVEEIGSDNKVWIILIPRLDFKKKEEKAKFSMQRPPQKIFSHSLFPNAEKKEIAFFGKKHFYDFKKQIFRRGFVYKQFAIKQIDTDIRIKPSLDEAQTFHKHMMQMRDKDCSSDEENSKQIELLFKRTLL
jgi:transcription elongation factor